MYNNLESFFEDNLEVKQVIENTPEVLTKENISSILEEDDEEITISNILNTSVPTITW